MPMGFERLDHELFMREALREAESAAQAGELPIGAVIVHDNRIVGRGRAQHNTRGSEVAHAEMNALVQAERFLTAHAHDGCVIYSTVEPCVMCLGAIVMSNIDHIVYALADKWIKPDQMLNNVEYVRRHIASYVGGVLADDSLRLWQRVRPQDVPLLVEGRLPPDRVRGH
jgi:tRNA(adenine34) deaminase